MSRYTARLQMHHVTYDPSWELELTSQMHRTISRIQNTIATPEQYARVINFLHSVSFEANRMRCELDICQDCRIVSTKKKSDVKPTGKEVKSLGKKVLLKKKKKEKKEKQSELMKKIAFLAEAAAAAEVERERLEGKQVKRAATELRKIMQDVKNIAQEIRVKALEVQKSL